MSATSLWTVGAMASAMGARRAGALPTSVTGLSIDSRTVVAGEAFFAMTDARDGHDFVEAALKTGAGLAVVAAAKRHAMPAGAPLLVVPDVLAALRDLAKSARARSQARFIGVTGSVGKTGTKEALRIALSADGVVHASAASYNNHWGVPLSLARCPEMAAYAVLEVGMNHPGEIEPLSRLIRPHVAIITTIEPVHLEFFKSIDAIADAKAEIFAGLEAGGAVVLNRDNAQFARLKRAARDAGVVRIIGFGEHAAAEARLTRCALQPESSTVEANILGSAVTYKLGAPGHHVVLNSLAVLATVALAGADLALAALALQNLQPATGRGARLTLDLPGGRALLIDESYNANPASMRAALALLGQATLGARGRRIAVIGDMLELGGKGADLHRELKAPIVDNAVDLVFCAGPLMKWLWEALPSERRGGYAETSAALEAEVLGAVRAGDAVMVKGSLGSKMGPLVKALTRQYSSNRAPIGAPAQG